MSVTERISQDFSLARLRGLWALRHGGVAWRHDVDYDTLSAALMAAHEAEVGIRSIYYVRLRAPEYNVFDPVVQGHMETILGHGHTIGLHFDTGLPRDAIVDLEAIARQVEHDHALLRKAIPEAWSMVSYHAPPHDLRWRGLPNSFLVADGPEWEGHYIADSRGVWRESPEERLKTGERLCVNCHPEWWFLSDWKRTALWAREQVAP